MWVPDGGRAGALHGCAGRGVLWEGLVWEDEVGNPACATPDSRAIQEAGRALGLGQTLRPPRLGLGLGRVAALKLLGTREGGFI